MGAFESIIRSMVKMDIFQLFFPWLLVLSVTYGILEKYEIFAEDAQVNGVIALSFAFISTAGILLFVPQGMLANLGAAFTFAVLGIIGAMVLVAVTGYDISPESEEGPVYWGALIIGAVVIIGVVGTYLPVGEIVGLEGATSGNLIDELVMPIVTLLFLIIVIGAVADAGGGD